MTPGEKLTQYVRGRQRLAWLALAWERLWPGLAAVLAVFGLFVAVALADLLPALDGWLHAGILGLFALALLAALAWGARYWRRPSAADARRRLERESRLPHRPLAVLEDDLATLGDPASRALWAAHRRRAAAALAGLKVGLPRPRLPALDPHGLRAAVLLVLVIGLAIGGSEPGSRLARALAPDFSGPAPVPAELEAWVSPPGYTGIAPFPLAWPGDGEAVRVPTGSRLVARLYGGRGAVALQLDTDEAAAPVAFRQVDALNHELEREIVAGDRLRVLQNETVVADWALTVVPDNPPEIGFAEQPSATAQAALQIDYVASDDYGLASARAELRLAAAPAGDDPEPLVLELPLPGLGVAQAGEASFHDLTAHPWAGLEVEIRLVAVDEIGQQGLSETIVMTLPAREFSHPVARALVEQRGILAQRPEDRGKVALALSAISTGPETFGNDTVVYLALRSAVGRLRYNSDAVSVAETQDLLWQTALRLEDGALSLAQRDLRAAQQALMDALARDADEAEIQRLMDELQQAIDRYLQALAEQAMQQAQRGQEPQQMPPNAQMLDQEDLKRMLDRARELSQLGAKDAAREMLRRLQEMLENLQAGPMQAMPQEMQGTQRQMQELGDLMRQQQQLLDRTYRESQQGRPGQMRQGRRGEMDQQGQPGRRGQPQPGAEGQDSQGESGDQSPGAMGDMAGEQEALRRRLEEIMRQLGQGGQAPEALGRAEQYMGSARDALGRGDAGPAADDQTRALDQLSEGMRGMAEELARQMGPGDDAGGDQSMREEDPLGRTTNSGGVDTSRVQIPEQSDLQRAREILDELRRRAGERFRPEIELDYIDRLLRRF